MKKFVRLLIIIFSSLLILYGLFVGVDCVRLYKAGESNKPLITIKETRKEDCCKYEGLGYSVTYKFDPEKADASEDNQSNNYPGGYVYSAEFRLFDEILLWAWIE